MPIMRRTAHEPAGLLEAWAKAFNRSDLEAMCALYAPEALLWGTTAQAVISDASGIKAYFLAVFAIRPVPQVQVTGCITRDHGAFAVLAGSYDLVLEVSGQRQVQPARFTFALRRSAAEWLIAAHHSSRLPMEPLVGAVGDPGRA